jgi:CelD/BcsL family acetyltransferase involved in cellulose biosynthesis
MARPISDYDVRIVRADALTCAETDAWRAIQSDEPAFANPLFGPDFAQAVGRVRSDVAVAVFRRDGASVAFFAHHRRPSGFGRPIGAPFSDYHGLIARADEGLSGPEALRAMGLAAFRHSGLVDPAGIFEGLDDGPAAFAIALTDGPDAHLEAARAASPKKFKNWRRLRHRLEEDFGPLRLRPSRDAADFEQLLNWKREQFVRTGVQDVLKPDWVDALMHDLFQTDTPHLSGLMLTLHAGDTLVGGHFGIRSGDIYHPWIASTAPELAALSPGQAFLDQAIRAMPGLGLRIYDLGPGHDHYKRPFASTSQTLRAGLTSAPGVRGRISLAADRSWMLGGVGRVGGVDKIRRRIDHIAASDPSLRGRVEGLVAAAIATRRRGLGGQGAED